MANRSIEAFLEDAFGAIIQQSMSVGRVIVDPREEVVPNETDLAGLKDELVSCIQEKAETSAKLNSPQGYDIPLSADYPLLKKYLRAVTLYRDRGLGSWVQVLPI
jgi:hypothetical protein